MRQIKERSSNSVAMFESKVLQNQGMIVRKILVILCL